MATYSMKPGEADQRSADMKAALAAGEADLVIAATEEGNAAMWVVARQSAFGSGREVALTVLKQAVVLCEQFGVPLVEMPSVCADITYEVYGTAE